MAVKNVFPGASLRDAEAVIFVWMPYETLAVTINLDASPALMSTLMPVRMFGQQPALQDRLGAAAATSLRQTA